MANYYLDIETTGLNPESAEIVTIQYQPLDYVTGEAAGSLIILKSWESSEEDILRRFQSFIGDNPWAFVAHGYNLHFENKFLFHRSLEYPGMAPIKLFDRPTVDLHPTGILLNGGKFKGSGLDKISGKKGNGASCLEHYKAGNYALVEKYINQEAAEYIRLYSWLVKNMPRVHLEFKAELL